VEVPGGHLGKGEGKLKAESIGKALAFFRTPFTQEGQETGIQLLISIDQS